MQKRRKLSNNQKVVIIYDKKIGYVNKTAIFKYYKRINIGEIEHETPVFDYENKTITGLECFWLLPENAKTEEEIEKFQYKLLEMQIKVFEISQELGYNIPVKVNDPELKKIADENAERTKAFIQKFGFDLRDESWIENELATTNREKNWFQFDRENALVFSENWDDIINLYNQKYNDSITVDNAKDLSKKRMRFVLGAYNTRLSGNTDKDSWKQASLEFEKFHRERENRMLTWSMLHENNFPLIRVKQPISFWPGPYFNECIEKIPHVFTSPQCREIKEKIVLRVISYDKLHKYIRLDFTPDVRKLIKPNELSNTKPWIKDKADYDMWVKPEEIETHLEILDPLE